jgi:hypothetical protein
MRQFVYPNNEFVTSIGAPSIGWKLYVYDTGTSNLTSIWLDKAQTIPAANPVVANADGFFATFFWTGTIDCVLQDNVGNTIDSVTGIIDFVSDVSSIVTALNSSLPFGIATGSGDNIALTVTLGSTDFSDGNVFLMRANAANTTTVTLTVNALPARAVKKIGGEVLIADDIRSNQNCILMYNLAQDCYYLINHEATFLRRDGTLAMTADLSMGSHLIKSLAAGTALTDAANVGQVQTAQYSYSAAGGTANTLTLTLAPSLPAYVTGQRFYFTASSDNTGPATINVNALGAKSLVRSNNYPMRPKDMLSGCSYVGIYDGTNVHCIQVNNVSGIANGNCQLTISGGNLLLSPYNGNQLVINGIGLTVPSAGVTLAPAGAGVGATLYIYAYNNAGSIALEYSATTYATDADFGYKIKNGDGTRSLVGIAYTAAGPTWSMCRSWFNDDGMVVSGHYTAARSTVSGAYVEIDTEIRCPFLTWSGDLVDIAANGSIEIGNTNEACYSSISIDGTGMDVYMSGDSYAGGANLPLGQMYFTKSLAEGYHYATIIGYASSGGITYMGGATPGDRTTLQVRVADRK